MARALVVGGTRFIGRHLVTTLLARGVKVTVATRGRTPDAFGDAVERVVVDRSAPASLRAGLGHGTWDVCFDQVCFNGDDARAACEVLAGRVGRYVLTSSGVVYPVGAWRHAERAFDPTDHPEAAGDACVLGYEEGKRQAERALFAAPPASAAAVRLPMILGADDFTRKLQEVIAHARAGTPIPVCSADFMTNYLDVDEAARFLCWVATTAVEGPINACSDDAISLRTLAGWVDDAAGTESTFDEGAWRAGLARLALPDSLMMDNARARGAGFDFTNLSAWLPALLGALA